ncbi:MAG TPA: hypothetical protein VK324_07395 [Tepidisphaeraceae bacterium]|nr:hypothetical protein [Tepidisphaeraceae bacterium]
MTKRTAGPPSRARVTGPKVGLVACAVLAGCFGRDAPSLVSDDPGLKIPAIKQAVQAKDLTAAPQLVSDLESDDPAVRLYAIQGLRRLSGDEFGYHYYADADARKPAVARWQAWLAAERDAGRIPRPR